MGKMISVKLDAAQVLGAVEALQGIDNGFVRAYARALNYCVEQTQGDMVSMATEEYSFKVAAVKARMATKRAVWSDLTAAVKSKGQGVLLSDFVGTRQTKTGLTVNVKLATGLQYIRHGFLNRAKSTGKIIAMRRRVGASGVRAARYPVEALYGPHPEVVWNTDDNWSTLQDRADKRLPAVFSSEVDGVLRQYG